MDGATEPAKQHPSLDVERAPERTGEDGQFVGRISLAALPKALREKVQDMDDDGDGFIDFNEVLKQSARLGEAKRQGRWWRNLVVVLFAVWAAQIATQIGTEFGVTFLTRQSLVSRRSGDTAVMTTTDGTTAVQVAIINSPQALSSALPNAAFSQLNVFQVNNTNTGSHVSLNVLGYARIQGTGQYGSVVHILTAAGTITLDGRSMSFADDVAPVFSLAGFTVAASSSGRRRLLDTGVDIVGFFNYLGTFDLDSLEASSLNGTVASNKTFASFPTSYTMVLKTYITCDASSSPQPAWCTTDGAIGGVQYTEASADYPGSRYFTDTLTLVVDGKAGTSLSSATHSFSSRTDVTFTSASGEYYTAAVKASSPSGFANCHYTASHPAPTTIFGLVPKLGLTPVFVDDTSTVSGVAARHFTFTATWTQAMIDDDIAQNVSTRPLGSTIFVLDYYDSITTHYPLRIFSNSTLLGTSMFVDIISFTPDLHSLPQTWPGPAVTGGAFNTTQCPKMKTHLTGASRYPKATPTHNSANASTSDTTSSSTSHLRVHVPACRDQHRRVQRRHVHRAPPAAEAWHSPGLVCGHGCDLSVLELQRWPSLCVCAALRLLLHSGRGHRCGPSQPADLCAQHLRGRRN